MERVGLVVGEVPEEMARVELGGKESPKGDGECGVGIEGRAWRGGMPRLVVHGGGTEESKGEEVWGCGWI